jgi:citrate synthase
VLDAYRRLPDGFKESAIIRSPGKDLMNSIARAVLMAYTYDPEPDRSTWRRRCARASS